MDKLTQEEISIIAFACNCYRDDTNEQLAKLAKRGQDVTEAKQELDRLKYIIYTKLIPESWSGEHPTSWDKFKEMEK